MVDVVLPRETYVLTAEEREIRTRTLMRPKLVMTSGEEHEIFAGENVPIPVGRASDAAPVFGGQQTNLQTKNSSDPQASRGGPQPHAPREPSHQPHDHGVSSGLLALPNRLRGAFGKPPSSAQQVAPNSPHKRRLAFASFPGGGGGG